MSIQITGRRKRRDKVVSSESVRQLEVRVARLERLLSSPNKDPFVSAIGAFADEPLWDDFLAAIEENRRQENARTDLDG